MKSNYIVKYLPLAVATITGFAACRQKTANPAQEVAHHAANLPDTGLTHLLQPVNSEVIAGIKTIVPQSGTRIFTATVQGVITFDNRFQNAISSRVSGRIERLYVKYNYQPVKKGQLIMEIYSPDLAAAQRELLLIARTDHDSKLLGAAKQKLLLLGMPAALIQQVINTGNVIYRIPVYSNANGYILEQNATIVAPPVATTSASAPVADMNAMSGAAATTTTSSAVSAGSSAPSPVLLREGQYVTAGQSLFTIYRQGNVVASLSLTPMLAAFVQKGTRTIIYNNNNVIKNGTVGLIEPVLQNGQSFSVARVYLQTTDGLQPGQLITGSIPVVYRSGWWLPRQAVWQAGNEGYVFRKDNGVFKAMKVQTGVQINDIIQVLTNINGWNVASNADFMTDSEGFIKPAQSSN